MKQFDLDTTPLHDVNLIEASAGTGKTFTLAGLYLRLILEHQLNVDQILVVTYTRAATQELRDRLRKKLSDERKLILDKQPQRTADLKRLDVAIQSFDEAAIFTIHSFCQQVLKDFAFESGSPFEMDLIGDDRELLLSVTDDFWRKNVVQADNDFSAYLLAKKQTPETLLQSIRNLVGKPYLQIQDLPEVDTHAVKQAASQSFENVKRLWQQHRDDYIAMLNNKKILSGKKYRADWVKSWVQMLENLLNETSLPSMVFEQFDRFTVSRLEEALVDGQELPYAEFWQACQDFHQALAIIRIKMHWRCNI